MCRFDWPKRVRAETPSSGCVLRAGSTDSLRRFVGETCQIAIGQFGDSACRLHECADKADTPRLRPKRASASIPLSGRSFGEAQVMTARCNSLRSTFVTCAPA